MNSDGPDKDEEREPFMGEEGWKALAIGLIIILLLVALSKCNAHDAYPGDGEPCDNARVELGGCG